MLHSDNGSPMKAQDFQNLLAQLGVTRSYSRPRVSNDNPFSESLFKTLKYTKDFPLKGFVSIDEARKWVQKFVELYNTEFLHSGIKFVTPQQRHTGKDVEILAKRDEVYREAKKRKPERWSTETRNWSRIDRTPQMSCVTLMKRKSDNFLDNHRAQKFFQTVSTPFQN